MKPHQANIASHIQSITPLNPCICPACGKRFGTEAGTNKHLSQSRRCAWYNKGKFPDLTGYFDDEDYGEDLPNSALGNSPPELDDLPIGHDTDLDEESDEEPIPIASSSRAPSPKRSRIENSEEDNIPQDIHPTAGKIYRKDIPIQERWHEAITNPNAPNINIFNPFESEVDWRIAEWFVDEGPSMSANDRLLKIPEVSLSSNIM